MWTAPRPAWSGEGQARDWDNVHDFVKDVEVEQSNVKRKPVDRRNNPIWGGAGGSSVHREQQGKAYRASA